MKCGYKYIADDGVIVKRDETSGDFYVYPFFREFALDPKVIEEEDRKITSSLEFRPDAYKVNLPLSEEQTVAESKVALILATKRSTRENN